MTQPSRLSALSVKLDSTESRLALLSVQLATIFASLIPLPPLHDGLVWIDSTNSLESCHTKRRDPLWCSVPSRIGDNEPLSLAMPRRHSSAV